MTQSKYRAAGVDIDAGNAFVDRVKPAARSTDRAGTMGGIGGFGAMFDLKAAGFADPVLVASTDGVGTKVKLALDASDVSGLGIDLVAMCANDLVVQGAEPLFFLDYFATGKLDLALAGSLIESIAEGCRQAGCALIGGETAEMPGLYAGRDFDLAGFVVGAAERGTLLPRTDLQAGDIVIGLPSSGVHSNGYSLVRKVVRDAGLGLADEAPFAPGMALGPALLAPTRIYVKTALAAHRAGLVKAVAHITGGGLTENPPRVVPQTLAFEIDLGAIAVPPVFAWLARTGEIDEAEMLRTFNCGIGLVLIVGEAEADALLAQLRAAGETPAQLGRLVPRADEPVVYRGRLGI